MSHEAHFPGVDLSYFRFPLIMGYHRITMNARISLWLQPDDLIFYSKTAKPGGLLSAKLFYHINESYETYLSVTGKSEGWVAGNVYLESDLTGNFGLTIRY